jgi:Skp family chaperone for outer membrane proteins
MFYLLRKVLYSMVFFFALFLFISYTPAEASSNTIGIVDFTYLVDHYPGTSAANLELRKDHETLQQEFQEKSTGLSDTDKAALDHTLGTQFEQKRLALLKGVADKVREAVQETAKQKGIDVVFDKKGWICGGTDITQDVLKHMNLS